MEGLSDLTHDLLLGKPAAAAASAVGLPGGLAGIWRQRFRCRVTVRSRRCDAGAGDRCGRGDRHGVSSADCGVREVDRATAWLGRLLPRASGT